MMIHQARGAMLRSMPQGARVLLSAGCAGTWYFDWVRQCYGPVEEHLGIEYYMPRPDDLPAGVTWIANTAADMADVAGESCDLVFSGQNIEHLWPEEVVGFLAESARVLRTGGHLVIDSPNRSVTAPMNYSHGEHTVELTPDEAAALVTLAGFEVTKLAGIWLCRDPRSGRVMAFNSNQPDPDWSVTERLVAASAQPADSFIWWLEARRTNRPPDLAALRERIAAIFARAWPERIQRLIVYADRTVDQREDGDWVVAEPHAGGFVIYGPYMPLRPGRYSVTFSFDWPPAAAGDGPAAICDVAVGADARVLVRAEVAHGQATATLNFTIDALTFAGQFRCASTGRGGFSVRRRIVLDEPGMALAE